MTEKWRWKEGGKNDWTASIGVFILDNSDSKEVKRQRCMCVYICIHLTVCDFRNANWYPLCRKDRVFWGFWGSQEQNLSLVHYLPLQSVMTYNSFWFGVDLVVIYWSRGEAKCDSWKRKDPNLCGIKRHKLCKCHLKYKYANNMVQACRKWKKSTVFVVSVHGISGLNVNKHYLTWEGPSPWS